MRKYTPLKAKQIKRITSFLHRAEKRGYTFNPEIRENLSKYSTQKLKRLTPEKLYKQATYRVGDTVMSGEEGRKWERTVAAKKAAETRRKNKEKEKEEIPEFVDIVLKNVEAMIQDARANAVVVGYGPWTTKDNADIFQPELERQIALYGRNAVAMSMENAPDEIKIGAGQTLYASSSSACHACLTDLMQLITGEIPSIDKSKKYNMEE